MSYLDYNYNQFLEKPILTSNREYSDIDFDSLLEGFKDQQTIKSGSITSQDGRLALKLDENVFSISDGTVDRIKFGKFDDGSYGLRISDREGNILLDITGETNLIQSSDKSMQLDLIDKQFRVYEGGIMRILIGYQKGGF